MTTKKKKETGKGDARDKRAIVIGEYIISHLSTVRAAAKAFGVSKSTVHKDVTARLFELDKDLARNVGEVLSKNKAERHLRGGEATKEKYKKNK